MPTTAVLRSDVPTTNDDRHGNPLHPNSHYNKYSTCRSVWPVGYGVRKCQRTCERAVQAPDLSHAHADAVRPDSWGSGLREDIAHADAVPPDRCGSGLPDAHAHADGHAM